MSMSTFAARIVAPSKTDRRKIGRRSLHLALACALLVGLASAPVYAQAYQDLYDFDCPTGCYPLGTLIRGTDGFLYGTALMGGTNNLGTIFKVNSDGTGYSALWNFDSTTGAPSGGLTLQSTDLNFYGTTGGGPSGHGTLFRFNTTTDTLSILHTFSSTDGTPAGPPIEGKDNNLYGLGMIGANPGTAYKFTVATATFQLLPKPTPSFPSGPLILASDGYFYGATAFGGKPDAGTVFRMTAAGAIKIVYPFSGGSDGSSPNAPLAQGKDGNLYGTTYSGGGGVGTAFKVTLPPPYVESVLYSFDGTSGGATNPDAGVLAASDGNFYGSTLHGGINGLGSLFELSGGSYFQLDDFSGTTGAIAGASPQSALMENTDGLLYGVTPAGGTNGSGDGVFFRLTPPNPLSHITVCCNWWVILDQPVTILGQGLTGVINVQFGSVQAQFRQGSNTFLTAQVPSAAIDAPVTVTLATGLQLQSAQSVHILPKITNLDPTSGAVGSQVGIVGGGFAGATKVTFGGVAATSFTVTTPGLIQATVPAGAKTGKVGVVTPNGSADSKQTFTVN
jgi:uncharacterized repeat protein (TIGR03803 family)